MIARLRQKTDRNIRAHLDSMRKESEKQHREILDAVAAGDLEASVAALKKHLEYTSRDLQSWMRSEKGPKNSRLGSTSGRHLRE
jgi:DNA-binding GntR family transcriptional regulator